MSIETVPQKQLNELETHIRYLLVMLQKAKLQNEPVAELLRQFEVKLGEARRFRFDTSNPDYRGY